MSLLEIFIGEALLFLIGRALAEAAYGLCIVLFGIFCSATALLLGVLAKVIRI